MMLREHPIYVHMQFTCAGLVVLREREAHIHAGFHQFAYDRVVAFVAACTIPTEEYRTLEVTLAQELRQAIKLRALDAVLHHPVIKRKCNVFFECAVTFGNDTIGAKPIERERSER